ncbi:hypothetical protein PTTG_09939, partial [Puccinia triticina 1-1 BBBD Race 1]
MPESLNTAGKMKKIKPQNRTWIFDGKDVEEFLEFYKLSAEIDDASDYNRARQAGCFVTAEIFKILVTLDGYKPPDWAKLKSSMLLYWGKLDKALYTERDLSNPLLSRGNTSIPWRRFARSSIKFKILKAAVDEVMDGQVALTFEDSRSTVPVVSPFQASNEIMKQMGEERKPAPVQAASAPPPSMDQLTRMFQSLEQYLKGNPPQNTTDRPPLICFYCRRERHGTSCCLELQKDKDDVASYQPSKAPAPVNHPRSGTPTRQAVNSASSEYKAGCGSLETMWYPPAASSQSFSSVYKVDHAIRKRHEDPKPFKAPLVPASQAKRPIRKPSRDPPETSKSGPEDKPELFDRIMNEPDPDSPAAKGVPSQPATPPKTLGSQPKV